jgi:hypothetical protein
METGFSFAMKLQAEKRVKEVRPNLSGKEFEDAVDDELLAISRWLAEKYDLDLKNPSVAGFACQKCAVLTSSVTRCPHCEARCCEDCWDSAAGGRCPKCGE